VKAILLFIGVGFLFWFFNRLNTNIPPIEGRSSPSDLNPPEFNNDYGDGNFDSGGGVGEGD
jgi:hypothetical protein